MAGCPGVLLSRRSPFVIELSDEDRGRLEALTRKGTAQARMVERARIVLAAAAGMNNADIAEDLGIALEHGDQVAQDGSSRKAWTAWRTASARDDRGVFPPLVVAEVKALACELPATTGVPLSKWSCAELARELVDRHVVEAISPDTVWRILDR